MNKRDFILPLTETEKLVIRPRGPYASAELNCCGSAHIFLIKNEEKFPLYNYDMPLYHHILTDLCPIFLKVLTGEAQLNPGIQEDVGLFYNKYHKMNRSGIARINRPEILDYDVYAHRIWYSKSSTTWLYNDASGSIIIEVTPDYRWDLYEKRKRIISYKTFIKNYKPLLKQVISHEIALLWFKQIIALMESMNNTFAVENARNSDFDAKEIILGNIYGYEQIKNGLPNKHKKVFEQAGLIRYVTWDSDNKQNNIDIL